MQLLGSLQDMWGLTMICFWKSRWMERILQERRWHNIFLQAGETNTIVQEGTLQKRGKKWLKERRWIKLVHHSTRLFTPTFWYWWLPHPLSLSPILPFLQKEKWKMRGKMTELVQYRLDSTIPFQSDLTPPYLPLHSSFSPSQIIHQTLTGSLALSPLTLLV